MDYAAMIGLAAARSQVDIDSGPVLFGWQGEKITVTVLLRGGQAVQALIAATMLAKLKGCGGVAFATVGPVSDDLTVRPLEDPAAVECAIGHGYADGRRAIWTIPLHRDDRGIVTAEPPRLVDVAISPVIDIIEISWATAFGDPGLNSLWLQRNGCEVLTT